MSLSNEKIKRKKPIKDKNPNNEKLPLRIAKYFIPWKGDKIKEIIRKIIFMISIVAFIIASVQLINYFKEPEKQREIIDSLESLIDSEPTQSEIDSKPSSDLLNKYIKVYNENKDTVGWIKVDDKISYPVLQSDDNDFYLYRDFYKNETKLGSIFADYRKPITKDGFPANTVLYGHDMKSGDMFGKLDAYGKDIEYFKKHQLIQFDSVYEEAKWKVFACFLTNSEAPQDDGVLFDYHNYLDVDERDEFNFFLDEVEKRSMYLTDVDVKIGDQFLTLSTCDNTFWGARFVVVARKVREGESEFIDTSKTVKNPNTYYPTAWYEVQNIEPPKR